MDGNPRDLPAMLTGCTFGIPTMDHKSPVLEQFGKADEVAHRRQVIADLEGAYRTVLRDLKSVDDDIEKERHSLLFNPTNSSYSYLASNN
ncbi:hypothetical protein N7509_013392 [Penicillium cosmopolitanum]|uniref:Uncharacterized protein n=1 Tax=Penicillium cosmopolitanum TaxID=1131564 RepID=A0A9W9SDA7_9EURO|nr:uncharacterized protein N7509_013392 [Penicillium cosmopolitanum]KAJ5376506.1 hypothetical protein N7509_013392 [Penicillium cosmopolitanum]